MLPEWMKAEKDIHGNHHLIPSWAKEVFRNGALAFGKASMIPIEAGAELQPERCEGAKESLILEGSLGQITLYQDPKSGDLTILNDYAFPGQERYSDAIRTQREFAKSVKGIWDRLVYDLKKIFPRLRVRADFRIL